MNLVVLSSNTDWYLFNFRLSLAVAIRDLGYEVVLASPPGAYVSELESHGFQWHRIRISRRGLNPVLELPTLWSYISLYRKTSPSLVHHFTIKPVIYGSLAARINQIPAVANSITGMGYVFSGRDPWLGVLQRILSPAIRFALSDPNQMAIFQNQGDLDSYVSRNYVRSKMSTVIPGSGVDPTQYQPAPEPSGEPVILMASRMLWDKGVGDLVDAARLLRERSVSFRVVLVGGVDRGNPSAISEKQLLEWKDEGLVEWWGHRSDMPSVYGQCHIVVLPSYHEGIPRTLIEAAAMERPIVTSDLPGCRAIVKHGENGLIIPSGDPKSLSKAIQRLAENPDLRRRMGKNGRRLVLSQFTDEIINRKTLDVYDRLLDGRLRLGN